MTSGTQGADLCRCLCLRLVQGSIPLQASFLHEKAALLLQSLFNGPLEIFQLVLHVCHLVLHSAMDNVARTEAPEPEVSLNVAVAVPSTPHTSTGQLLQEL